MTKRKLFDEERELPSPWEWIIVILFSAAIVAYGTMVYLMVGDAPRFWDVGQLPDTPAESIYSTEQPHAVAKPQRQLPRLPEAQVENAPKPRNEPLKERGPKR